MSATAFSFPRTTVPQPTVPQPTVPQPTLPQPTASQPTAPVRKSVVGIAEIKIISGLDGELLTYALGSCLGLVVFDPDAHVAGLLHAMLPSSAVSPEKATATPAMFVDTGVPELFKACYRAGAVKQRLQVYAAGCAHLAAPGESDMFQIGRRNMVTLRKLLWKNGVLLTRHDTEGAESRTMSLSMATGKVHILIRGQQRPL